VATTPKVKAKQEPLIYVGPNNKHITKSSIFIGGYPPHITKHIESCPALNNVFIPVSELPEYLKRAKVENSAEQIIYNQVQNYFKNEGAN